MAFDPAGQRRSTAMLLLDARPRLRALFLSYCGPGNMADGDKNKRRNMRVGLLAQNQQNQAPVAVWEARRLADEQFALLVKDIQLTNGNFGSPDLEQVLLYVRSLTRDAAAEEAELAARLHPHSPRSPRQGQDAGPACPPARQHYQPSSPTKRARAVVAAARAQEQKTKSLWGRSGGGQGDVEVEGDREAAEDIAALAPVPICFTQFVHGYMLLALSRYLPTLDENVLQTARRVHARRLALSKTQAGGGGGDGDGGASVGAAGGKTAGAADGDSGTIGEPLQEDDENMLPTVAERVRYGLEVHVHRNSKQTAARIREHHQRTSGGVEQTRWVTKMDPNVRGVVLQHRARLRKVFSFFSASSRRRDAMDIREFLFMMRELNCAHSGDCFSLEDAARIYVAVTCFIGDPVSDKCNFECFCEAIAQCCKCKMHDGYFELHRRLESFMVHGMFHKLQERCRKTVMWPTN